MVSIHEALEKAKQEQQALRRGRQPSLTVVPSGGEEPQTRPQGGRRNSFDPRLVTVPYPMSLAAGRFRSLCQSLDALGDRSRGCLGITSALRGEGRSTVSANLGVAWAEAPGERVLVIDADSGHPALASLFGVQGEAGGLADLLQDAGAGSIEEGLLAAVCPTGVARLEILPWGRNSTGLGPLLDSAGMEPLLKCLLRAYTRVIVDFPPVTTSEEARMMGRLAAATLLVVRAGKTDRSAVRRCRAWLDAARRGSVLGCVLNGTLEAGNFD